MLDRGAKKDRWSRWRPTISLVQHPEFPVARLELLYQASFERLADQVIEDIGEASPKTRVVKRLVSFENPWDFGEVYAALHDYCRSIQFHPEKEHYYAHITTGTHVAQICLFLLAESRYIPGKLIQTSPSKQRRGSDAAVGEYDVIDLDLSKYDQIASRFRQTAQDDIEFLKSGIATRNRAFNRMIREVEHVAVRSREPILLIGPTGAGKSLLARRIHELKQVRGQFAGRFVEVNCATLRGDAALSALFGHVKGAFTGAMTPRQGLLREADAGMLFLDEIGELGLDEQAMLLRAIEEKRFFPLGGDVEVSSDFQLICGTNRNLRTSVAAGEFREDLLERINLWTFDYPGLRDRLEDVEPNLDYEIERFAEHHNRQIRFSREARQRFLSFATSNEACWSGNFRDLNSSVIRMATLAPGGRITRSVVDAELERLRTKWAGRLPAGEDDLVPTVLGPERAAELDRFDRVQLAEVLRVCRQARSLSDAGRTLFSESRKKRKVANDADRLRKYLARFDLKWPLE